MTMDVRSTAPGTNQQTLSRKQEFLIEAAVILHRYGTPSHRLERVMTQVARTLGIESDFLYSPTAIVISLREPAEAEFTVVRRVDSGPVDVDKLIQFDRVLSSVERKKISVESGAAELRRIDQAPPLYGNVVYALACSIACASIAVFFRGSGWEVIAAGLIGLLVTILELSHQRFDLEKGLLEPVSGVVAALGALLVANFCVPIDDRLVTAAALIILIPGLRITVALTELAVGHLSAGVARLAGALVSMATLFVGVSLVWKVSSSVRPAMEMHHALPGYWQWIALAVAPVAFAILFRAGVRQLPIIAAVSVTGVVVSWSAEPRFGIEVASFLAAFAVGSTSNLYARVRDIPALVALSPGMLILVPGSVGYRSLSALLEQQTVEGVQFGFTMILIGANLVGGLLVSNVIVPPKRIL